MRHNCISMYMYIYDNVLLAMISTIHFPNEFYIKNITEHSSKSQIEKLLYNYVFNSRQFFCDFVTDFHFFVDSDKKLK